MESCFLFEVHTRRERSVEKHRNRRDLKAAPVVTRARGSPPWIPRGVCGAERAAVPEETPPFPESSVCSGGLKFNPGRRHTHTEREKVQSGPPCVVTVGETFKVRYHPDCGGRNEQKKTKLEKSGF